MRDRLSVMLVASLVMVMTLLLTPVAFAQENQQQRDPNEGEPKHEINELQNRLHQTEDKSKENRLEGKIDTLQDQRRLGGLQAAYDVWPEWRIKQTRDLCIAGAAFTFGLFLLHDDCKFVGLR